MDEDLQRYDTVGRCSRPTREAGKRSVTSTGLTIVEPGGTPRAEVEVQLGVHVVSAVWTPAAGNRFGPTVPERGEAIGVGDAANDDPEQRERRRRRQCLARRDHRIEGEVAPGRWDRGGRYHKGDRCDHQPEPQQATNPLAEVDVAEPRVDGRQ